ncbi:MULTISPECIES: hypothetical protein [Bacillus]|uniref:Uncharacterized protein n=2 Tax=Bacillus thuringiensis TaxID=1428 RepID=A0AAP4Q792_BACTU|nr:MULTISPECIES: hypothetical protein [Bacillus]MEC0046222.1 hypothetical protein [Bacillus cereus]AFV21585.1 hypothetical protein BTB_502p02800 [Bacillus thuringiensis Bt407]EEM25385.1 hypothetical protein bthur0002_60270 [Bacillus thuringiensis Bt407]ERI01239.1 hypothetical protein BTCBT_002794 [Bacillus thuringiensis T01-328]MBN6707985.1 hypothetical protein [Bacillus thuringiensis]
MKYHITPKQAKEITEEQFYSLFNEIVPRKDWADYHHKKVTIGKMIDYLDGVSVHKSLLTEEFVIEVYDTEYSAPELTDALWLAVKDCM